MESFEVERVGGELRRFGVTGEPAAFEVVSPFEPSGDQPQAIESLVKGVKDGDRYQVLLGVTGSGKTFTMAKTIEALGKPTLVMAPNKTLAAQLASELKEFFPHNAVVYFVSYYDYYQPEAYVPQSDTYIEKDSSINEEVEMLRHQATASLLSRRDVIVVASVSCIYGIGSPEDYAGLAPNVDKKVPLERDEFIHCLIDIHYDRNDYDLSRGCFRVRGDVVDVYPPYAEHPLRFEFFGDEVELIAEIDEVTGEILREYDAIPVWPASHYVTEKPKVTAALKTIEEELEHRVAELKAEDKLLEAQRLQQRTDYDLEMLETMGFTNGIENYSRHLDGRKPGEPPFTLIDYFPKDMVCIIDESHVTVPQIRGMHEGDRSRKVTLVEHGFRLPSALDNRPLRFDEFEARIPQFIYVSATPGDYELRVSQNNVEQIIRPTGLLDPKIDVRPVRGQIDDLLDEIKVRTARHERVLVTTLTKRMAEDLTDHLLDAGVKVNYMHSDTAALDRVEILRDLRAGKIDVLVGINLLREGRHPRRGQRGLPAQPPLSHPDHRPRRAQRGGRGHHVRGHHHGLHARGHRRDGAPPRDPDGLQQGARHRAQDRPQGHQRHLELHRGSLGDPGQARPQPRRLAGPRRVLHPGGRGRGGCGSRRGDLRWPAPGARAFRASSRRTAAHYRPDGG